MIIAPISARAWSRVMLRSSFSSIIDRGYGRAFHRPNERALGSRTGSHPLDESQVCRDRGPNAWVAYVSHAAFFAELPNNRCDRRVVHVADVREEVVLDLEIQPAQAPSRNRI